MLFSNFLLCHSIPSHWYLSESIQKICSKCCNFLKMILGTNSWSQYLKKMGHWNMMTIKRNDSSLERFSKMGISTSSIKKTKLLIFSQQFIPLSILYLRLIKKKWLISDMADLLSSPQFPWPQHDIFLWTQQSTISNKASLTFFLIPKALWKVLYVYMALHSFKCFAQFDVCYSTIRL